jgi:hypothetical protein
MVTGPVDDHGIAARGHSIPKPGGFAQNAHIYAGVKLL